MPRDLSSAAKRIWKESVELLATIPNLLSQTDGDILADYARTLAKKQTLEAAMRAESKRKVAAAQLAAKRRKAELADREPGRESDDEPPADDPSRDEIEAEVLDKYENRILRLTRMATQLNDRLGLNAAARSRMHVEAPLAPIAPTRTGDPAQGALFGDTRGGSSLEAVN